MDLASLIATKLLYSIAILTCFNIFLDVKQANKKSFLIASVFLGFLIPVCCALKIQIDYVIWMTFVLLAFFMFKGNILKKIWVIILSQAIWNVLKLLLEILVSGILFYFEYEMGSGKAILRNSIEVLALLILCKTTKDAPFRNKEEEQEQQITRTHRVCMIILVLEANFIIDVGMYFFVNGVDVMLGHLVMSLLFDVGGFYMVTFALNMENNISNEKYKFINQTLQEQINRQFSYYQELEKITKETRAIKHDMNNHLVVIKGLAEGEKCKEVVDYIDNLQCSLSQAGRLIQTGNSIVDAILNEKTEVAKEKEIEFSVDICLKQNVDIKPIDVCILLANSLDNAIEACEKISNKENRHIDILGRCNKGYLSFIVSNSVDHAVNVKKNQIITDKADKLNHGFGLQNIKNCVNRNNGKFKIECTEDLFTLYIDIPLRKKVG